VWTKQGEGLFFHTSSWPPLLSNRFLEQVFYDLEPQLFSQLDEERLQ
jgi:hypothetical protein